MPASNQPSTTTVTTLGKLTMGPWQALIYSEVETALKGEDADRRNNAFMVAGMLGVAEMQRPSIMEKAVEGLFGQVIRSH